MGQRVRTSQKLISSEMLMGLEFPKFMKVFPHLHKETGGKTSQIASTLIQGHNTVHASVLFLILKIS